MVAFGEYSDDGTASTLKARDYKDATDLIVYETHPADSRVKEMGNVCQTVTSRWGTGGGNVPLVQSIGFTQCDAARDVGNDVSPTLRSGGNGGYPGHAVAYSIREDAKANNFSATQLEVTPALQALRPSVQSHHAQTFIAQAVDVYNQCVDGDVTATLTMACGGSNTSGPKIMDRAVRRLTPTECERLQGFPDGYTNIPWRGKPDSPDAPRYKAMGNSMAVPCMKWLGNRIQELEDGLL
jgi:DNA (cytosine-5)-methyltransferase 1